MAFDSKDVAKALKADLFAALREAGFSEFRTRTAWRTAADTVAVLDFRSLGSYLGSAVGVTSHSLCAEAGVYYKAVHATPWSKEATPSFPEVFRCQARRILRKRVFQLWPWRPDVWYVNRTGSNLESVVAGLVKAVRTEALPWLDEMADAQHALAVFESRHESSMWPGIMREILGGGLNSYARTDVVSALALASGQRERARSAWERMLANPYYKAQSELRTQVEERMRLI